MWKIASFKVQCQVQILSSWPENDKNNIKLPNNNFHCEMLLKNVKCDLLGSENAVGNCKADLPLLRCIGCVVAQTTAVFSNLRQSAILYLLDAYLDHP